MSDRYFVCAFVEPHPAPAIGTVEEICEDTLFFPRILQMPLLHLPDNLLNTLKGLTVDDRLMDIAEYRPILLRIVDAGFIPKRFGVGLEIDDIPAVFLLRQHLGNGRFTPPVRIRLCFLAASRKSLALPVGLRDKHFFILQLSCNRFIAFSLHTETEHLTDDICRFRVDHPLFPVLRRLPIPVWRR